MQKDKVFRLAKGFRGRSKNCLRIAKERVEKALQYAYRDRRQKKRDMRSLWIQRINAGTKQHGVRHACSAVSTPAHIWNAHRQLNVSFAGAGVVLNVHARFEGREHPGQQESAVRVGHARAVQLQVTCRSGQLHAGRHKVSMRVIDIQKGSNKQLIFQCLC